MQKNKNWVQYLQAAWEGFFEEVEFKQRSICGEGGHVKLQRRSILQRGAVWLVGREQGGIEGDMAREILEAQVKRFSFYSNCNHGGSKAEGWILHDLHFLKNIFYLFI